MGFLKKIGKAIEDEFNSQFGSEFIDDIINTIDISTGGSLKNGFLAGLFSSKHNVRPGALTPIVDEQNFFNDNNIMRFINSNKSYSGFTNGYTVEPEKTAPQTHTGIQDNDLSKFLNAKILDNSLRNNRKIYDNYLIHSQNWHQQLSLPDWDYGSFINERAIWQKGLSNPFGEQGFFYFKIFFKFDTQFGLFGGILNDDNPLYAHNSALKYLYYLAIDDQKWYYSLLPLDRIRALQKFTAILSYINCNAPWFFHSVRGLDKAGNPVLENEYSKEKSIEIECNTDAIDMRLTSLMDLYNFACYDTYANREVIPENLRKFDMLVMIFAAPIKTLHTAIRDRTKVYPYKSTYTGNSFTNLMSFKLFEFNGCEIDINSLGSMIPGDMNNEKPFNIGKGTIKIKYDKCTQYLSNEFQHFLFGTTGFYWTYDEDINNPNKTEYDILQDADDQTRITPYRDKYMYGSRPDSIHPSNTQPRPASDIYVDIAESYTKNNIVKASGYALGNIYHEDNMISLPPAINGHPGELTDYFKAKIKYLKNKKSAINEYGMDAIIGMLGPTRSLEMLTDTMTTTTNPLYKGPGSNNWLEKLRKLKNNTADLGGTNEYKGPGSDEWYRKIYRLIGNRKEMGNQR